MPANLSYLNAPKRTNDEIMSWARQSNPLSLRALLLDDALPPATKKILNCDAVWQPLFDDYFPQNHVFNVKNMTQDFAPWADFVEIRARGKRESQTYYDAFFECYDAFIKSLSCDGFWHAKPCLSDCVSDNFMQDEAIMLEALALNHRVYFVLPPALREDNQFMTKACSRNLALSTLANGIYDSLEPEIRAATPEAQHSVLCPRLFFAFTAAIGAAALAVALLILNAGTLGTVTAVTGGILLATGGFGFFKRFCQNSHPEMNDSYLPVATN